MFKGWKIRKIFNLMTEEVFVFVSAGDLKPQVRHRFFSMYNEVL